MKRSILFFGHIRDVAGTSLIETVLPEDIRDVPSLVAWLAADNPFLGDALRARSIRVAIDRTFAPADANLENAEEIAFMSPLSGG